MYPAVSGSESARIHADQIVLRRTKLFLILVSVLWSLIIPVDKTISSSMIRFRF